METIKVDRKDFIMSCLITIFLVIICLWTHLNSIRNNFDLFLLFVLFGSLVVVPMLYSIYYNYKLKKQLVVKVLEGWYLF